MARVFTDGGAQALATAAQQDTCLTSFSVAFWMNRTATPVALRAIIAATIASTASAGWYLQLTTGNLITAGYPMTTTDKARTSTTAPTLNTWVHVVVTHNQTGTANTDFTFYFNGKSEAGTAVTTGSGTHDSTTATKLEIGNGNVALAPPTQLGPISIWNRALSPAEALALAIGRHPTWFPEGLVEYFDLEGSTNEEGALRKLFLVQGATNPTNVPVNPAMEKPAARRLGRVRSRFIVPAIIGGQTLFYQTALDGIGGAGPADFYPSQAA